MPSARNVDVSHESLLRLYEKELDAFYRTYPLVQRDRADAVYSVLSAYDSLVLFDAGILPRARFSTDFVIHAKYLEDGLTYAIRWLHDGKEVCDLRSSTSRDLAVESAAFLHFARDYAVVADLHYMYGRKQLDVCVEPVSRTVSFQYRHHGLSPLSGSDDTAHAGLRSLLASRGDENTSLFREARVAMTNASWEQLDGRIVLRDGAVLRDPALATICSRVDNAQDELIPAATDLLGFTVEQFNSVVAILRRWSFCALFRFIENVLGGVPQVECSATQIVERSRFDEFVGEATGLEPKVIGQIIRRLSYDERSPRPDILLQPLVCGPRFVSWSPRVMQSTRALRNVLRVMLRTKAQRDYTATVVGSRERRMLVRLGDMFATRGGCQFKVARKMAAGGEKGEMDLLVYSTREPSQLLLIEGKAVLGADEINEVDAVTKEMQKGQDQLRRCLRVLDSMSEADKCSLYPFVKWHLVREVFAVVVTLDSDPNEVYDHSEIPGIALSTISLRCRDKHFRSPRAFWAACKERRWQKHLDGLDHGVHPLRIGDVTYHVPIAFLQESASDDQM